MRRRSTLLLNILLVLSVALSGTIVSGPIASGSGASSVSAPDGSGVEAVARHPKRERKKDRKKADRKQDRKQKDRKQDRKKKDRKQDRETADQQLVQINGDWRDFCRDPGLIKLTRSEQCTHGPDPAPPGFDVNRPVQPLSEEVARQAAAALTCEGNGQEGFRVQVFYVRGSNQPSTFAQFANSIRGWAGGMDQIYQDNADATGPERGVRFVHDDVSSGCQIDVEEVVLTPAAVVDFDRMIAQLKNQGHNRTDRIYLLFVDTTAAGICGIADWWDDERDNAGVNHNNYGPRYARVDRGCWDADTAAHEVMHNLGGVGFGAPNTSGGAHCIDEWDIMCYSDEPDFPVMQFDCLPGSLDVTMLDCGKNDYYNTNPGPGSYLDTNWNPADNRFLIGAPDVPLDTDFEEPAVNWVEPVANEQQHTASAGTIGLQASVTDNEGVELVEFWRYDNEDDEWVLFDEVFNAPYVSSIPVEALSFGVNVLSADAYDAAENWNYALIEVNRVGGAVVTEPPPDLSPVKDKNDKKKKDKKKKKGKGKKGRGKKH